MAWGIARIVGLTMRAAVAAVVVTAGLASSEETAGPDDKPFAQHRVVLQLSDASHETQAATLNVANNLITYYGGPDAVDIEVVAFGPGVELLFEGNRNTARISSLVENGVRFYVCGNTLDTLARTGSERQVLSAAIRVQAGVPHILERVASGFVLVKP